MRVLVVKPERVGGFPFPVVDAGSRKTNFCEVQRPFTLEQAVEEADRCVRCGNPVCIDVCPLQTDIRGMCDAIAAGDLQTAYRRVRETNPLPGVTARCCPQLDSLCESVCVLGQVGQPVAAGMLQRFVADWERELSKQSSPPPLGKTGKRIAVVGGGPAGVAAADLLTRYGHEAVIYEELPVMGGTAWYGIPDYHLSKEVLQYEIDKVRQEGVEMKTGTRVGRDVSLSTLRSEYDAVLIATGSKDVPKSDIPGTDLKGVFDGYAFLQDVFVDGVEEYLRAPKYDLGKETLVIGGGNSALDCARTALRLTGGNVTVAYRRTEQEMPVDRVLVQEAKDEGVKLRFLVSPSRFVGQAGKLGSVVMSVMRLGALDKSGRRSPEPTGAEEELKCDTVILAIGRGPNSFLPKLAGMQMDRKNSVAVDERHLTSVEGVFAAGDVVTGESLVVKAMASGRDAAQRIHEYLMGLSERHTSLYDYYFVRRTTGRYYEKMLIGKDESLPPP